MDKILIHGGHPLSGSIKVSGSKNSSLPILAATLLTREPCVVHGVPDLSDTHYMLQILIHLGAQVERASGTVSVSSDNIGSVAPYDVVRKMRASICFFFSSRRRHTRWPRDWSSDVCSSDLDSGAGRDRHQRPALLGQTRVKPAPEVW